MELKQIFSQFQITDTPKGDVKVMIIAGIPSLNVSKKGSVKVEIESEFAKQKVSGYCFSGSALVEILGKAEETQTPVIIRIEKQRKKDVDKDLSIVELSKDMATGQKNIITSIVGVYDINNSKWILEGNHADVKKDTDIINETLKSILEGSNKETVDVDSFFEVKQKEVHIPNPTNFDKQSQLVTMLFTVKEAENKYGYELEDETRQDIAIKILKLADEIQKLIKQADYVDYKDFSHNRARYMIFSYERLYRNLDKENVANIKDWIKDCYNTNKKILEWTKEV